jgi:hypothetical protein
VVDFQYSTQRYIPDDRTLHNHRRKNLKSLLLSSVGIIPKISLAINTPGSTKQHYGILDFKNQ